MFNLKNILHVAIKCSDLQKTIDFYCGLLGLHPVQRPPFGYPGAWLANVDDEPIIHLYGGRQGLSSKGETLCETGSIDHISIMCEGFTDILHQLNKSNLKWREFKVPKTDLYQIFCYDPNGVLLELTFQCSKEGIVGRNDLEKQYIAGDKF
jgi:catechol 2,3-dioxygenase-like lactoylglutathione lyase family enzyme